MATSTTLVLLPGLDGTEIFFRPFLRAFPAGIRARVVQYPVEGPHRYDDLLETIRAVVADLDDYYVLASSFSGPLAVRLAAAEPARVRGLVLCSTFVTCPMPRLRLLGSLAVGPVIGTVRTFRRLPVWLSRAPNDAFRIAKAEAWHRVPSSCLAARIRATLEIDARAELRRCTQPVAVVSFEEDDVVPRRATDEILRECPSARTLTLPGGHFGIWWHAESVAQEVADFVNARESQTNREHVGAYAVRQAHNVNGASSPAPHRA